MAMAPEVEQDERVVGPVRPAPRGGCARRARACGPAGPGRRSRCAGRPGRSSAPGCRPAAGPAGSARGRGRSSGRPARSGKSRMWSTTVSPPLPSAPGSQAQRTDVGRPRRPARRPSSSARELLPLGRARSRRRRRARRRNRRWRAPAPRSAPRRSRRPRRSRTPSPRTRGRSRGCGRRCRCRPPRSRRRSPRTDSRQCGRFSSSSRTIMVRLTRARAAATARDAGIADAGLRVSATPRSASASPAGSGAHGLNATRRPDGPVVPPLGGEPPRVLLEQAPRRRSRCRRTSGCRSGGRTGHGPRPARTRPAAPARPGRRRRRTPGRTARPARRRPRYTARFISRQNPESLARGEPLAAVLVAPPPGERVHRVEVAIGHVLDQLRRRGVIRHRPDQADRRLGRRPADPSRRSVPSPHLPVLSTPSPRRPGSAR